MKEMLKPNWVNSLVAVIFFILGMFLRIVPAWLKMKNGSIWFGFSNLYGLLINNNFSNAWLFGTPVYFAYWWVSYLIIIAELALVYVLASVIYKKIRE